MASNLRSTRSVRHSLASSTAARVRSLSYSLSLVSKCSKSVKASAVAPAKPQSTLPSLIFLTLRALLFITVSPIVTWPSPAIATCPSLRTTKTVVDRIFNLEFSLYVQFHKVSYTLCFRISLRVIFLSNHAGVPVHTLCAGVPYRHVYIPE